MYSVPCQYGTTCRTNQKNIYVHSWERPLCRRNLRQLSRTPLYVDYMAKWPKSNQTFKLLFSSSTILPLTFCDVYHFELVFLDGFWTKSLNPQQNRDLIKTSTDTSVFTGQQLHIRCCSTQVSLNYLTFVTLVMSHTATTI